MACTPEAVWSPGERLARLPRGPQARPNVALPLPLARVVAPACGVVSLPPLSPDLRESVFVPFSSFLFPFSSV